MLRAFTFGQCVFETPVARIAPDSEVHFALLLYIASGAPDGVSRDDVVRLLWPQTCIEGGRHCLRQAMYRLRHFSVPVHLRAGYIVLDGDLGACDVRTLLHGAPARDEVIRLGALPFLPSYAPSLGEAYAHWVEELRARLATRLRRVLADEVALARSCGRFYDMGRTARALLALDPLNEVATMGLAEALALEGSKVEAIRLLEEYEEEVGTINVHLQIPVRVLRRRVSESLDDSLLLRRFEVPFVGREYEFSELRTLFRDVRHGAALAAFVTGEAGIGKSRLSGELLRLAALDGATVATYNTSAGDAFTPISTLVTVGHLLLSLPGALGCAQEHLNYVRRLGTPETVTVWSVTGMAADILYAQLVYALAELVSAIAEEAPLILFVDDAERLHGTTWRVLMDVLERLGDRSVLLLLAARTLPSWFGTLGPHSCDRVARHFRLFPFARQESMQFLHHWSAKNQMTIEEGTRQTCASTSQGNPFYLTELASHLGRGGDPTQTPKSIRELIEIQHAALSKGAQRLLTVIALFESRATTARVRQVLEASASDFMEWLDELEVAGLLGVKGAALGCRHFLVGHVAVSQSMPSVVRFAHSRIANLLEVEADETSSVELLGDCLTHWECAGENKRAYQAAMKLGFRLIGMGFGTESHRAFAAAERSAEDDDALVPAIDGLITASRLCADWSTVLDECERRRVVVARSTRRATVGGEFELVEAEACIFTFEARSWNQRLLDISRNAASQIDHRIRAATLSAMLGDNDYAPEIIRHAYFSVCSEQDLAIVAYDDSTLLGLVYHTSIGDPHAVPRIAHEYAARIRNSNDKRLSIHGLRRAANALVRIGRHTEAHHLLDECNEMTADLRLPLQDFATSDVRVSSHLLCGDVHKAEEELQRQREIAASVGCSSLVVLLRYSESIRCWLSADRSAARILLAHPAPLHHSMLAASTFAVCIGQMALRLVTGKVDFSEDELAICLDLHRRGRALGRQDLNTAVLTEAHRRIGKAREADHIESEYAKVRREITNRTFDLPSSC